MTFLQPLKKSKGVFATKRRTDAPKCRPNNGRIKKKSGRKIWTIDVVHRKEMHMKETFGDRIKRLRENKKLKQEQVALALRVNRKAISHYENNLREPSFETLIKMAELYRVSTDYLLGMENTFIINAAGLSEKEFSLLSELVADITEKNSRLKDK